MVCALPFSVVITDPKRTKEPRSLGSDCDVAADGVGRANPEYVQRGHDFHIKQVTSEQAIADMLKIAMDVRRATSDFFNGYVAPASPPHSPPRPAPLDFSGLTDFSDLSDDDDDEYCALWDEVD
jgi:hypothetical protein